LAERQLCGARVLVAAFGGIPLIHLALLIANVTPN
jgi:hypothetical protein